MGSTGITSCPLRDRVDPRALRFSAAATATVLGGSSRSGMIARYRPAGRRRST